MGGRIGFERNDGPGATFWFEIELPTVPSAEVKPRSCAGKGNSAGVRILLVEDLPMNQELACTILRRAGHHIDVANDGIEAITAVENNPYDVILMDIQMPRMDGVTAARLIRQLGGPAKVTPIIAMTANALPEQVRAFRRAGMDDYVAKPFKQKDLHDAIRRVVLVPGVFDDERPQGASKPRRATAGAGRRSCR
jgi:CheY-like chemotaxis protein